MMADVFEALMVICFGISWPINISKAWKARTAKSTSVLFYFFIWLGYIFVIIAKAIKLQNGISTPIYVWFFYVLNTIMVTCGILIYFRNKLLDRKAEKQAQKAQKK